mmetsp:Transcript_22430/g.35893  ORF Transcript_22430/g.35893 Transcript_22430/m.35893 type:complete len:224 (-) Transcript_22430:615-1286(-)
MASHQWISSHSIAQTAKRIDHSLNKIEKFVRFRHRHGIIFSRIDWQSKIKQVLSNVIELSASIPHRERARIVIVDDLMKPRRRQIQQLVGIQGRFPDVVLTLIAQHPSFRLLVDHWIVGILLACRLMIERMQRKDIECRRRDTKGSRAFEHEEEVLVAVKVAHCSVVLVSKPNMDVVNVIKATLDVEDIIEGMQLNMVQQRQLQRRDIWLVTAAQPQYVEVCV